MSSIIKTPPQRPSRPDDVDSPRTTPRPPNSTSSSFTEVFGTPPRSSSPASSSIGSPRVNGAASLGGAVKTSALKGSPGINGMGRSESEGDTGTGMMPPSSGVRKRPIGLGVRDTQLDSQAGPSTRRGSETAPQLRIRSPRPHTSGSSTSSGIPRAIRRPSASAPTDTKSTKSMTTPFPTQTSPHFRHATNPQTPPRVSISLSASTPTPPKHTTHYAPSDPFSPSRHPFPIARNPGRRSPGSRRTSQHLTRSTSPPSHSSSPNGSSSTLSDPHGDHNRHLIPVDYPSTVDLTPDPDEFGRRRPIPTSRATTPPTPHDSTSDHIDPYSPHKNTDGTKPHVTVRIPRRKSSATPPSISPRKSSIKVFASTSPSLEDLPILYPESVPEDQDTEAEDDDEIPPLGNGTRRASNGISLGQIIIPSPSQNRSTSNPNPVQAISTNGITPLSRSNTISGEDKRISRMGPPVPTKSPLRGISRVGSGLSEKGKGPGGSAVEIEVNRERGVEGDEGKGASRKRNYSTTAVMGTPVRAASPMGDDLHDQDGDGDGDGDDTIMGTEGAREIRGRDTIMTIPSIYSIPSELDPISPSDNGISIRSDGNWRKEEDGVIIPDLEEEIPDMSDVETEEGVGGKRLRRKSRMDDLWGRMGPKRGSKDSAVLNETQGHVNRVADLPKLMLEDKDKALPSIPTESPTTASSTRTDSSTFGVNGHATLPTRPPRTPNARGESAPNPTTIASTRSPSMPTLSPTPPTMGSKASRLLGISPSSPFSRPVPNPLLPSAITRSPNTPSGLSTTPSTPNLTVPSPRTPSTTKRTHLLREIASSERAYANDLALIRDAFLKPTSTFSARRTSLRPSSSHSTMNGASGSGENVLSPGISVSDLSIGTGTNSGRTSSVYTYQTAETKRSSSSLTPPLAKSPVDGYFGSGSTPSPRYPPTSYTKPGGGGGGPMMGPPVGKMLSVGDLKGVFLNVGELAGLAEELAGEFERALGEGEGEGGREGEGGGDRLGEVFAGMPSSTLYLSKIQSDPLHAQYITYQWSQISPHTHAWNLDSMLIKPVQRITKYPLLFDDLLSLTTPVHPDYFGIRRAAEMARGLAREIDELKRRQDVVADAIGSVRRLGGGTRNGKSGLKLFKSNSTRNGTNTSLPISRSLSRIPTSSPSVGSVLDLTLPERISVDSVEYLRGLVGRVDEVDAITQRLGKEIVIWTAVVRECWVSMGGVSEIWEGVVGLGEGESGRAGVWKGVVDGIVERVWGELNDQIKSQIMPALAKLLDLTNNPRKVIQKHQIRQPEYTRYLASTQPQTKKPPPAIDRTLLTSAQEFVALHQQLVDELPAFLEGYMRIMDLVVGEFASVQAKYFGRVRGEVERFGKRWITRSRGGEGGDGEAIIRDWERASRPYAEAMDKFNCTKPSRAMATRLASFNARPGSRSSSPSRPGLRASPSLSYASRPASPSSAPNPLSTHSSNTRTRSASLLGPNTNNAHSTQSSSTATPGRFNLLTRSSSKIKNQSSSHSRPASLHLPDPTPTPNPNRHSFGLPKFSPAMGGDNRSMYEGLGLSPSKPVTPSGLRVGSDYLSAEEGSGESGIESPMEGLGLGDVEVVPRIGPFRGGGEGNETRGVSGYDSGMSSRVVSGNRVGSERNDYGGGGERAVSGGSVGSGSGSGNGSVEVDVAEGWRGQPVLYCCACVAGFEPAVFGNKRYRGLRFLPLQPGDLLDIYHEVGRIDELPNFPYPEVGVDNDGVLVASGESGDIGLAICSFLEPLRD